MEVVIWRGKTENELVVVLGGDRRYVMLVDEDVEVMRVGFRYFVEQNKVEKVSVVGFGVGDDMYDVMVVLMCVGMGLRLCVEGSGESVMRVVYWGENDFYRRVLVEYGRRCVSKVTLRRVVDDGHIHFRFLQLGWSQRQVVLFMSLLALLFGSVSFFTTSVGKIIALGFLLLAMICLLLFITPKKKYEK
jgi:hypothetical protein